MYKCAAYTWLQRMPGKNYKTKCVNYLADVGIADKKFELMLTRCVKA